MIVCICHRISDREIARGVRAGMDFSALQLELGVATQCGNCESCVRSVVAQCSPTMPVAAIERAATDPARAGNPLPGKNADSELASRGASEPRYGCRAWTMAAGRQQGAVRPHSLPNPTPTE